MRSWVGNIVSSASVTFVYAVVDSGRQRIHGKSSVYNG